MLLHGGNSFTYKVVSHCNVSLVELSMWNKSSVDCCFVIAKHHEGSSKWNTEMPKGCCAHRLSVRYRSLNAAVSTADCSLEHQSTGVLFIKCRIPVTDLPEMRSWRRLASTKCMVNTSLPKG
mmetsp:Transcript_12897/g.17269  ORF Transcript_12897/g.17269 Transcript_12897/m.17269 type:complete len:122 (+) Transcript_12897:2767-3132(+)